MPYVSLLDSDADGVFDYIEYNILDESGKILKSVEDYGMDGQADLIADYVRRSAVVFYSGKWLTVDGIDTDGERTVSVDGIDRPLGEIIEELKNRAF